MIVNYPENWIASKDLEKDIAEKIYYLANNIEGFDFTEEGLEITLGPDSSGERKLNDDVQELMSKLAESYKLSAHEIVEENEGKVTFTENPYSYINDSSAVVMTSPGVPVYQGVARRVISGLDEHFRKYALSLGAVEHLYPTTLPTISLIQSGYLKSFPQHALLVGTIHHDLESLKAIAEDYDKYSETGDVDDLISKHTQILAPTVCGHCFELYKNKEIEDESIITATSHCHRHEGSNHTGLDRLQTYLMREIIYFGGFDFVREYQEKILTDCKHFLTDWGVKWRIAVASDPFFATGSEIRRAFQTAFRLKYELQCHIPYDDKWIAVASFNHHQDSLITPYKIACQDTDKLNSGCFGVGLDRLLFSLFSQKGVDFSYWPDQLTQDLGLEI